MTNPQDNLQEKASSYTGQIIKALSGFYYVEETETKEIFTTRARGQFRNTQTTPLVGDFVEFTATNTKEGTVMKILPRYSEMVRPAVANVDVALLVASVTEPQIQPKLLDRFLVYLESVNVEPVIYFSKLDLAKEKDHDQIKFFIDTYTNVGYKVIVSSSLDEMLDKLKDIVRDHTMVVVGQSGVGKSTLLNRLLPGLDIETGEISTSLGRGRHTTRHTELHDIFGGKIADTPGFSSIDIDQLDKILLSNYFPEMRAIQDQCQFRGCTHIHEPKCAVKNALAAGEIAQTRYDSYLQIFEEIENAKPKY
ncbi:ribosome small subunit-dependent GTPase A [Aerococcus agrisoli]|uniref:Small ribosomal subunit biogenesis GTPase RsgA n=1 Tax=Aerococcus agrisoli TaxID=2487350 RepID=A0A3N4GD51_9LACT|nr:ribosome small subunit-dependent GTPase A [Aerococcus agrisoli]RPA60712.1 ribosome small subunit-dependent GTPase A [Aerococcus agrisoli]